jgi:hypothetical protein
MSSWCRPGAVFDFPHAAATPPPLVSWDMPTTQKATLLTHNFPFGRHAAGAYWVMSSIAVVNAI